MQLLHNDIETLLSKYQSGDELEIRFGYYDDDYFKSSILYQTYNMLLSVFKQDPEYQHSFISNTIHMYSNGIREIKTTDKDTTGKDTTGKDTTGKDTTGKDIIIKKNKKTRIDNHDMGVRIALSNEKVLSTAPDTKYIKKSRNRHTFIHQSNKFRIDLTIDTLPKYNQCQCEIEFLEKPSTEYVLKLINMISTLIHSHPV